MLVELTVEEIELIPGALDSHAYWQVADEVPHARNDGYVMAEWITDEQDPDREIRNTLEVIDDLDSRLSALVSGARET